MSGEPVEFGALLWQLGTWAVNLAQDTQEPGVCRQTAYPRSLLHRLHHTVHLASGGDLACLRREVRGLNRLDSTTPAFEKTVDLRLVHLLHRVVGEWLSQRSAPIARKTAAHNEAIGAIVIATHELFNLEDHAAAVISTHNFVNPIEQD